MVLTYIHVLVVHVTKEAFQCLYTCISNKTSTLVTRSECMGMYIMKCFKKDRLMQ